MVPMMSIAWLRKNVPGYKTMKPDELRKAVEEAQERDRARVYESQIERAMKIPACQLLRKQVTSKHLARQRGDAPVKMDKYTSLAYALRNAVEDRDTYMKLKSGSSTFESLCDDEGVFAAVVKSIVDGILKH